MAQRKRQRRVETRIPGAYHVTKVEAPLRPPTSLNAIENALLRQRARDAWLAAMRLRRIVDGWWSWLLKLKNEGDADPAETLHFRENAATNVRVLCTLRVNSPSFRGPPEHLIRLLPEPAGFNKLPSITDEATRGKTFKEVVAAAIPWQKNEAFIQQTWGRLENLTVLQGELMGLAKLIEASPSAAFCTERESGEQPVVARQQDRASPLTGLSLRQLSDRTACAPTTLRTACDAAGVKRAERGQAKTFTPHEISRIARKRSDSSRCAAAEKAKWNTLLQELGEPTLDEPLRARAQK